MKRLTDVFFPSEVRGPSPWFFGLVFLGAFRSRWCSGCRGWRRSSLDGSPGSIRLAGQSWLRVARPVRR